jgi:HEAT repeat protein
MDVDDADAVKDDKETRISGIIALLRDRDHTVRLSAAIEFGKLADHRE